MQAKLKIIMSSKWVERVDRFPGQSLFSNKHSYTMAHGSYMNFVLKLQHIAWLDKQRQYVYGIKFVSIHSVSFIIDKMETLYPMETPLSEKGFIWFETQSGRENRHVASVSYFNGTSIKVDADVVGHSDNNHTHFNPIG